MRKISIGAQGFEDIRRNGYFYIDKTDFIREWWEASDKVTLIARPRRFGKTLNMSMLECFFSDCYSGRSELFDGLHIWDDKRYREIQGTYPVIFISFANVKEQNYANAREAVARTIQGVFQRFKDSWAQDSEAEKSRYAFMNLSAGSSDVGIQNSLHDLSCYLEYRYGRKCLILLDEYDTPLQEAYIEGYWDKMAGFMRNLFNSAFKTNPSLERAILTGITRVSKESIFSGLNNINVVTTTSRQYETAFGFVEEEVDAALEEYGLADQKDHVRTWYDGFTFGSRTDIYNPWSIINFLDKREFDTYWANTSENSLINELIRVGDNDIKSAMETLLEGGTIESHLDEEVVFSDLQYGSEAVWSLLLASGYLKAVSRKESTDEFEEPVYTLAITNGEVRRMFARMIRRWFSPAGTSNDEFIKGMLTGDTERMNAYMNKIAEMTFSSFDTGGRPSNSSQPERFYHGFVLGLLVRENARYDIRSNRESGYGRYDICMFPKQNGLPGIVIEFKVQDTEAGETRLSDTADSAVKQILDRDYAAELVSSGVSEVLQYGFAFSGKRVLIKMA